MTESRAGDLETAGGVPAFLIVGAMKSGTTSLYAILRHHPDIFMPPLEVGYFDIDDVQQHPDFFRMHRGTWHFHPYSAAGGELSEWYRSLFIDAEPHQVMGERSTSYMASSVAPERIRQMIPEARLIFMMRDPVRRAYSNYWHLLRSGEATGSFERTLRYRPSVLFERGLYREHVQRYLDAFPRKQLLFLVFEEFVKDPIAGVAEVCTFLGVDRDRLPPQQEDQHENRGRYPWSRQLQYVLNAVVFHGLLDGHRYIDSHLPALRSEAMGIGPVGKSVRRGAEFFFKVASRLNCSRRKRPEIKPATRELLKYLYEDRNAGLSRLIGKDLSSLWPITRV